MSLRSSTSRVASQAKFTQCPTPKDEVDGDDAESEASVSEPDERPVPNILTNAASEKTRKRKPRHRCFGLGKGVLAPQPQAFNTDDYEQKYPDDKFGEELGPNARFYCVYLEEHEKFRFEMVEGWKDSLDVLLVFAGLFSAVVTTIVVEASQSLQPDYAQITTSLLIQQSTILSHMLDLQRGIPIDDTPSLPNVDTTFAASNNARWVNGLWFTSLSLSLATALIAVVAKQWLQSYMGSPTGTPRDRARLLHMRYISLEKWRVPGITGLLPFLLHFSLLLFFSGLVIYLLPIDRAIGIAVGSVALACYVAYFATTLLSLLASTCAYKTSLSYLGYSLLHHVVLLVTSLLRELVFRHLWQWHNWANKIDDYLISNIKWLELRVSLAAREQMLLKSSQYALSIDQEMFKWMYSFSFSPSATSICFQAAYSPELLCQCSALVADQLCADLVGEFEDSFNDHAITPVRCERLASALLSFRRVHPGHGYRMGSVFSRAICNGIRLRVSTWASIIRGAPTLNPFFLIDLTLFFNYRDRFSSYWKHSQSKNDGFYSLLHLVTPLPNDLEEQTVSKEDRQMIIYAVATGILGSWHYWHRVPDLFQELGGRLKLYWETYDTAIRSNAESVNEEPILTDLRFQPFALAVSIHSIDYHRLSSYQLTEIIDTLDDSVRSVYRTLHSMSDGSTTDKRTAECCASLLEIFTKQRYVRHLIGPEYDRVKEIQKYAREQLELYNARTMAEENQDQAENGLSRLVTHDPNPSTSNVAEVLS